MRNDVPKLLGGGKAGDIDLFDDLSGKDNRFATVDRLTGLYAAADAFTLESDLSRSRYSDAIFRATKGMGIRDREKVAVKAAAVLSEQFADFWYPRSLTEANVSADRACLEFGHRVPAGKGAAFLKQAIRTRRTDFTIDNVPVESADPSLAALWRGLSIRRQDFERSYPYGASQILESRKALTK